MKKVYNTQQNGIELYFESKPEQNVIEQLKAGSWRWHSAKKCWYTRNTPEADALSDTLAGMGRNMADPETAPAAPEQLEVINLDGYKAGDLFYTSWGYDQTNIDYYQVIKATKSTLTLREIGAVQHGGDGWTGNSSADPDNFKNEKQHLTRRSKSGHYQVRDNWLYPTTAEELHSWSAYA